LKRLKRLQRQVSRRKIGSNNYVKAKQKLAKLHYRISNIRKDCLHKTTSEIIDKNQVIILEDLRISNMLKNHTLALSISDVGAYEFRRQTGYKADWNNREVIFADSFYPSSKLCSSCGHKNEDLTLKDRTFECKVCNNKIDRDLNASLNLKSLYTGSFSEF
jgi:putative transposase